MAQAAVVPDQQVAGRPAMTVAERGAHDVLAQSLEQFGALVGRGANEALVQPIASGGAFLGVAVVDQAAQPSANDAYAVGRTAAVLTKGVVWVVAGHAVTAGEAAYYDNTGALTDVASGNTPIPNATFDSSAASGALVKLSLA